MKDRAIFAFWAMVAVILILISALFASRKHRTTLEEAKPPSYFEISIWELIRREDIRLEKYICPAGKPTIGVGLQTDKYESITLDQAKDMLYVDFQERYDVIEQLLPNHSRNEIMAVALLAHNIGINKLISSPQWDRIKNKTHDCVDYWSQYCYYTTPKGESKRSPNLQQARLLEIALWNNDVCLLKELRTELRENASEKYIKLKS